MVAIESSIDCSQLSLVHKDHDRVDDDSRHIGFIIHTMASERADVRDLSSSLRSALSPALTLPSFLTSTSPFAMIDEAESVHDSLLRASPAVVSGLE